MLRLWHVPHLVLALVGLFLLQLIAAATYILSPASSLPGGLPGAAIGAAVVPQDAEQRPGPHPAAQGYSRVGPPTSPCARARACACAASPALGAPGWAE